MFIRRASVALLLASGCFLCGCELGDAAVTVANGQVSVTMQANPPLLVIYDASGNAVLTSAQGSLIASTVDHPEFQPQAIPGWDGYQAHEAPWKFARYGRITDVGDDSATLELGGDGAMFSIHAKLDGDRVQLTASSTDGVANKMELQFLFGDDEHVFGLGERFASVDHRGLGLYAWAEEGALGGGEDKGIADGFPYPNGPSMTYFPVPYSWSTAGFGMFARTTRRTEMHMGDEAANLWRIAVSDTTLPLTIYVTPDPLVSLDRYTEDSGRPLVPSQWVWGNWRRVNREAIVDGEPEYRLMRERKIPITTIEDAVHFLPALSFLGVEDQLRAWVKSAHDDGYKILAYNNPYVASNAPSAMSDYAYGVAHDYFERAPDGTPATTEFISGALLDVSAIDLTNPRAVTWFQSLLQRTADFGYDGWMHDFGEYVARTSTFAGGSGEAVHNQFPVLSAKAAHDFWMQRRPDDFSFHVRSGYAGTQAYAPVVWGGDAEADFDETQGLPSVVRGGMNLAMSGVPYWGSDGTGFKCITDAPRDREVWYRWTEFTAVSPIMREEDACSNPVMDGQTKWKLWNDDETQALYRNMASLHTRMAPYLRALALSAHARGVPIMMHPVLLFPNEPGARTVDDSYFFGPSIYAAPVVRRGVTTRTVWIPPGRYLEWTEGTIATGPHLVDVPAPLDRLPMFLVEGQLLPLLDADVQTLVSSNDPSVVTESDRSGVLDVVVALGPGRSGAFELVDGTQLEAKRVLGAPTTNVAAITDPSQLPTCNDCAYGDTFGSVNRVRVTTSVGTSSQLVIGDVALTFLSPTPRRIRWDVRLLP